MDAFVSGAGKKRKAALFVQLHCLPNTNDDQQYQEFSVLVVEDGKGAKRWCLLADEDIPILLSGLTLLAAGKPNMFFPSGCLVVICRELNRREHNPGAGIDVGTGHFPEPNTSIDDYLLETKTMAKTQPTKLSHMDRLEAERL